MKPVNFKEATHTIGENREDVEPMRVSISENNEFISCWELTLKERLKALITGKIYLSLHTQGKGVQPSFMTTNKWELFYKPKKS